MPKVSLGMSKTNLITSQSYHKPAFLSQISPIVYALLPWNYVFGKFDITIDR